MFFDCILWTLCNSTYNHSRLYRNVLLYRNILEHLWAFLRNLAKIVAPMRAYPDSLVQDSRDSFVRVSADILSIAQFFVHRLSRIGSSPIGFTKAVTTITSLHATITGGKFMPGVCHNPSCLRCPARCYLNSPRFLLLQKGRTRLLDLRWSTISSTRVSD